MHIDHKFSVKEYFDREFKIGTTDTFVVLKSPLGALPSRNKIVNTENEDRNNSTKCTYLRTISLKK